jgi:diguanylate cyclase (GGDEF)-like protein
VNPKEDILAQRRKILERAGGVEGAEASPPRDRELEILFATIQDLTSTLATDEVIQRLLKRVVLHLDSEIASILLLAPDRTLRISHAHGLTEEVVESTCVELGRGISGYVARTGVALLVEDVAGDPRFHRYNHERYYTNSAISVPLVIQGGVVGVINVNNKRSREPYSLGDLHLMEAMAGHAAVALRNARRFEETLARAQTDALTGLANHGHLWATLEAEATRADRYGRQLSVAMLDADHFKAFNDRYGHVAGDEALIGLARVIRDGSRVHDTPARYGGEEFAVVLPETSLAGARAFSEKIRTAIEAKAFADTTPAELTVSVGVATFPEEADSAQALVERADARLFKAKAQGRNRVCSED